MKKGLVYSGLCGVIVVVVGLSFYVRLFSGIEHFIEDRFFTKRDVGNEIIIVAIDNESINRIGQWPWPREVFARAFRTMEQFSPAAVGVDVIFSEPSRLGAADDRALASAIHDVSYPIIFPVEVQEEKILQPLGLFQKTSLGHVNVIQDRDGIVRTFPFTVSGKNPFAYEVVVQSGKKKIDPTTLHPVNRIVYSGPAGTIPSIPFWQLLDGTVGPALQGKEVFMGVTAPDLHDDKPIPFSSGKAMAGIEIHTNIAAMLLQEYRLEDIQPLFMYLWIAFAAVIPLLTFLLFSNLLGPIILNVIIGIVYFIIQGVLFSHGSVANSIHVQLAWILSLIVCAAYRYFVDEKEKRAIKKVFSKYVSHAVLEEIVRHPENVKLGGERKKITILFSDIRGFTSISEKMKPEDLMHIINEYLAEMAEAIIEKRGLIDKFIGDAIMAFWGAPLANRNQARDACTAAIEMNKRLEGLNKHWHTIGLKPLVIGVGINTGEVVVGNMGSKTRWNYSVLGDEVNLASRLEGLNKMYGTTCIIGEATKKELAGEPFILRELDLVTVKGKKEPTLLYELIVQPVDETLKKVFEAFSQGRRLYQAGDWDNAIVEFKKALALYEDPPSKVFLERCLELKESLPLQWNGVYEFHSK